MATALHRILLVLKYQSRVASIISRYVFRISHKVDGILPKKLSLSLSAP